MGYETALHKAWHALRERGMPKQRLRFLDQELEIDPAKETIASLSGDMQLRDFHEILVLHYLAGEHLAASIDDDPWLSFKELGGGEIYFSTFRKRAIDPILAKYGHRVRDIYPATQHYHPERIAYGTAAVAIKVFPKIRTALILWEEDEEFPPECTILFNAGTKEILPTEDIAVLAGIIAYSI
jgi:hypothetical protein